MTIWCQKWMDWTLYWILIIILPYYKKKKCNSDGTPENHARIETRTGSLVSKMDFRQKEMKVTQAKMDANRAEIKAMRHKKDANLKEIIENMKAW
jgi:hypothetical protein